MKSVLISAGFRVGAAALLFCTGAAPVARASSGAAVAGGSGTGHDTVQPGGAAAAAEEIEKGAE